MWFLLIWGGGYVRQHASISKNLKILVCPSLNIFTDYDAEAILVCRFRNISSNQNDYNEQATFTVGQKTVGMAKQKNSDSK